MKKQDYRNFVTAMTKLKHNPELAFEIEQEGITTRIIYSKEDNTWIKHLLINGEVFSKSLFNPAISELVDFVNQFDIDSFRNVVNEFVD